MPNESTLTERQREIRHLLKQGLSVRKVSILLGISTQAVYKHVARIRAVEEEKAS